jgi:hypothetical protein
MLSFAIFDNPGPASSSGPIRDVAIRTAYLIGPDEVPIPADIRHADGVIRCEKRSQESAALCAQVLVDPADASPEGVSVGLVSLQTCLLPERDRPYLLSLELARHRLMMVLNKLEDWALFDLPPEDPILQLFDRARQAFTKAVVAAGGGGSAFTPDTDRLARQALSLAIEAGELLTLKQAGVQHGKRMSGELADAAARVSTPANAITDHEAAESRNALIGSVGVILPTPPQVGCVVNPDHFSPGLQKVTQAACDFICLPMRWIDMEPTEGKYAFAKTDRWIEWAVRTARLPIVGGPVIEFRPRSVPDWLYIWEHDYETLRELVYEHVKNIVTRYRRTVGTWTIASGLHVNTNFSLSYEQVMDLTRMCVMVVRKLQPSARVIIEIDQPWGEYYAENPRSVPPITYAEAISQAGIHADLFGLRIEMGQPEIGHGTHDLMAFSALLDRYATLERPLCISALSAPSEPVEAAGPGPRARAGAPARPAEPGYWRRAWSPEAQCRWMTSLTAIAASKPYVHSICWHELHDPPRAGPAAVSYRADGLLTSSGQAKPALARLAEIKTALREKKSPLALPALPTTKLEP